MEQVVLLHVSRVLQVPYATMLAVRLASRVLQDR
jgi:hypothetical protein